ncbi:PKD domain-containing protein [Streptacidiphilus monticola]
MSAAQPGDTVMVVEATDDAVLSRSGTPDAPITLTSADMSSVSTGTLALQSVHDVRISRFRGSGTLHIADSRQVSVESSELADISGPAVGSVDITGSSADVTLRQTYVLNFNAPYAVQVGAGTQRVTLSTNVLRAPVRLSGTSDALVAGNSVTASGTSALTVSGGSAGTVLVDNVFDGPLKADPDSLQGMRESYDNVRPGSDGTLYDWGGTAYTTVTAFQAAPGGFGVQDLVTAPSAAARNYDNWVDAADETAPGELPTDVNGRPRVDNTLVPNTGTGSGTWDRGRRRCRTRSTSTRRRRRPTRRRRERRSPCPTRTSTRGGPRLRHRGLGRRHDAVLCGGNAAEPRLHQGAAGGQTYAITETKRVEGSSYQQTFTTQVVISPPGPMTVKDAPGIRIPDARHPLTIDASTFGTLFFSPWGIAGETMDFGDGTGTVPVDASNMLHTYARPGRYRVTQTATDRIGRTISASAVAQVGAAFAAVAPARLLDTRNGTGRPRAGRARTVSSASPSRATAYPAGRPRSCSISRPWARLPRGT